MRFKRVDEKRRKEWDGGVYNYIEMWRERVEAGVGRENPGLDWREDGRWVNAPTSRQ